MGIAIAGALVIVGVFMLSIGASLAGGILNEVGAVVGDVVARVASQPPATAAPSGVALDTPMLDQPTNHGYTNQATLVLSGSVPRAVVNKSGYLVRVYAVAGDSTRIKVADAEVGSTTRFITPELTLAEGVNTFVGTLVSPSGEGNSSPPVTYTLDTKPPKLTITSPAQNSLLKGASVDVVGKSEAGVTITVRNRDAPGGSPSSMIVDTNTSFRLTVRLVAGGNTIDVTATDQANNTTATILSVKRDYGKLAALLSASPTKINTNVTTTLTLTVHATSSTGSPLANASVTFTVNVNGLGPILSPDITTNAKGTATWTTSISGAAPGPGSASVLVTSATGDQARGTTPLTAY